MVQYNAGKATQIVSEWTGSLSSALGILLAAIAKLRANELRGGSKMCEHIAELESISPYSRKQPPMSERNSFLVR